LDEGIDEVENGNFIIHELENEDSRIS